MKTEVEKLEKNKVVLKVEVPAEELVDAYKWAYKSISQSVSIPGFRRGFVPPEVIDRKLGKEAVDNEVLKEMLPTYYWMAVQEAGVEPIDQPQIEVKQLEKSKALLFNATVETKPEVRLGEYKGLTVTRTPAEAGEQEVQERLEYLRNRFAQLEVVEEQRPIQVGDFVLIDFKGFLGDKPYEKGTGTDYLLEIGSKTFVPGFEEQLVGAKKGEIRDVKVTFPQNYQFEEVAGKEVRFNVLIKELKRKVLPELTDEFAKELGEFENLEALKTDLEAKLRESKKVRSDMAMRASVLKQVSEAAEVEIPESMRNRRTEELVAQFAENLKGQGMEMEAYLKATKSDFDTLRNSLEEEAISNIKSELVLEAIAKKEGIVASDEELDQEIASYAKMLGKPFEETKKTIEEKGNIWVVREDVTKANTMKWLVENAIIEEEQKAAESQQEEPKEASAKEELRTGDSSEHTEDNPVEEG
jgi:trigger factor